MTRPPADLQENGKIVRDFRRAIQLCNINHVPVTVRRLLETGAWMKRFENLHYFTFEPNEFARFITSDPVAGCGWELAKVEALLKQAATDTDTLRLWRQAITPPAHVHHPDGDNITITRGTSRAYTLDRLQRDHPELYARVLLPPADSGHLSASAAAIVAGFRKKLTPLDSLRRAWSQANDEERAIFRREIEE